MHEEFNRWTAMREAQLVFVILQGLTTVAEAVRPFDRALSEIEKLIEDGY
jgi:hypothetical protein